MAKEESVNTDNYYIIKGRFKGASSNTYGLFIIFISVPTKTLETALVAASHFSTLYEYSPDMNWASFEEKITTLKWKNEVSSNISHDLQLLISNTIKQLVVEEFIEAIESNDMTKIEEQLIAIIAKGLVDKSVVLDLKVDKVSHEDIIKVKDERARKEKEEREEKQREEARKEEAVRFKIEEGGVVLNVSLVLAPVSGLPVTEAKKGDEIMVKIDSSTERGNYFIDLLNARTPDGEVTPVKGTIKDIFLNAMGEYQIITELGPGIYGRTLESEQVKIKKYTVTDEQVNVQGQGGAAATAPSVMKTQSSTSKKVTDVSKPKDYFMWVVGAITFLLAILLIYLFFSGIL